MLGPEEALKLWRFVRSETLEILGSLSDEQLLFRPEGDKWQAVYYQFACIVRTQMVYSRALEGGEMDFSFFSDPTFPDKHILKTKAELTSLLNEADKVWRVLLESNKSGVKWPGALTSAEGHATRLIAHERMHHGLLIAYFTLAGWELPPKFRRNWAL